MWRHSHYSNISPQICISSCLSTAVIQITLKFSSLKHQCIVKKKKLVHCLTRISVVRNLGISQLGGSGSGALIRLQSGCQLRLQSSEGLTRCKESILNMAQMYDWCQLEASVYYRLLMCTFIHTYMDLSYSCINILTKCQVAAPRAGMSTESLQSSLFDPVDHSPPGSSVHGVLQARMLKSRRSKKTKRKQGGIHSAFVNKY